VVVDGLEERVPELVPVKRIPAQNQLREYVVYDSYGGSRPRHDFAETGDTLVRFDY
jgi:hypothetical protein